jgi:hypothetical protein
MNLECVFSKIRTVTAVFLITLHYFHSKEMKHDKKPLRSTAKSAHFDTPRTSRAREAKEVVVATLPVGET